ncbi:MAG: hypothetical protein IKU10_08090 [Clostridia bacterium]|nr:hypothetical protein [Clostridia bacterium]
MTLHELGKQYLEQEVVLRRRLQELRALAKTEENPILMRRIYYLASSAAECHKTGLYLMHYYEKEERV